ncbi:bifunctional adenosylcobinamide kinase/adenosylcobinamide-phosphate guanylyltransferase [Mycobacterium yunnanensis]|uniref:Adenosylcobinamide kinase n=1 Tax=Mycobacterium yunnanensis TaxID=368477 RepID=A0A9X3BVF3_9MYCO|nr:bifunctional adenosylcobinamide kinase/adenosylcobinamide-phosphate guanylyltransferase [Mycobacterium yunnanensis]MCV7423709.1 bifunctional adenosylcobinamide kinase/adenosylcobinamide-phosphate guanylyltransferase [Mycobacterium yunnanensis]
MRVLALGGIRSGKSQWAETALVQDAAAGPIRYVATGAVSDDPDWVARVDTHRRRRDHRWSTVESADVATLLRADAQVPTLVDDVGGWLVGAMDRRDAWTGGSVEPDVDDLVAAVEAFCGPLALVSPEVGLTVVPATAAGRLFADALGLLNQRLAAACHRVVLVVAGQPLTVKDGPSS